jgi:hypothetical protein
MTMRRFVMLFGAVLCATLYTAPLHSQDAKTPIPAGSKVFIEPMGGFETYLRDAFGTKKVPLAIVDKKEDAEYDISGHAESQKASTAKKIIMGSWHSREEASIQITNLKSGDVVYAYSYHTSDSAHGKKSSAESCAKHLKSQIEQPAPKQ